MSPRELVHAIENDQFKRLPVKYKVTIEISVPDHAPIHPLKNVIQWVEERLKANWSTIIIDLDSSKPHGGLMVTKAESIPDKQNDA